MEAVSARVVITGIGLVSSVGIGTEANWSALLRGCSGIATITRFDVSQFSTHIAGEVKGFDPLAFIDKKDVKKMDAFIQYAMAASEFAIRDSSFVITPEEARASASSSPRGSGASARSSASTRHIWTAGPVAFSVLHSVRHHQSRFRPGLDPLGSEGAEHRDVHCLLGVGARHRRGKSSGETPPT